MAAASGPKKTIGRYELGCEIAAGWLGPLWLLRTAGEGGTELPALARRVPLANPGEDEGMDRVSEAAWTAMELKHDSIPNVLEVVVETDELAIITDHVEAVSLRTLQRAATSRRRPLPQPLALRIMSDVFEALASAQEQALTLGDLAMDVHGGLTPDSVLVATDGRARVTDLLVAGASARVPALAHNPDRLAYSAPETLDGAEVGARCDVFGAGVMLWELLSERRLFLGNNVDAVIQKLRSLKIPRLEELELRDRPRVNRELAGVVARALAREPEARFGSVAELLEALLVSGSELGARPELAAFIEHVCEFELSRQREALKHRQSPVPARRSAPRLGPSRSEPAGAAPPPPAAPVREPAPPPAPAREALSPAPAREPAPPAPTREPPSPAPVREPAPPAPAREPKVAVREPAVPPAPGREPARPRQAAGAAPTGEAAAAPPPLRPARLDSSADVQAPRAPAPILAASPSPSETGTGARQMSRQMASKTLLGIAPPKPTARVKKTLLGLPGPASPVQMADDQRPATSPSAGGGDIAQPSAGPATGPEAPRPRVHSWSAQEAETEAFLEHLAPVPPEPAARAAEGPSPPREAPTRLETAAAPAPLPAEPSQAQAADQGASLPAGEPAAEPGFDLGSALAETLQQAGAGSGTGAQDVSVHLAQALPGASGLPPAASAVPIIHDRRLASGNVAHPTPQPISRSLVLTVAVLATLAVLLGVAILVLLLRQPSDRGSAAPAGRSRVEAVPEQRSAAPDPDSSAAVESAAPSLVPDLAPSVPSAPPVSAPSAAPSAPLTSDAGPETTPPPVTTAATRAAPRSPRPRPKQKPRFIPDDI